MADRETVLAALFTALSTAKPVSGETITFERNRETAIEESTLAEGPAVIMWDGDEEAQSPEGRPLQRSPVIQTRMQPEIWGFVKAKDGENIGTTINALLKSVKAAIYGNAALKKALGAEATTQLSLSTGLGRGKTKQGDFALVYAITHTEDPTQA